MNFELEVQSSEFRVMSKLQLFPNAYCQLPIDSPSRLQTPTADCRLLSPTARSSFQSFRKPMQPVILR